ncbi:MAG TPA: universal stress protein [Anaerolineales bacterium]|nr:universal stress protein [Anaerolineales bacterium]
MSRNPDYHVAVQDFHSAHLRGKLQGVLARITGRSNELLSYEEVAGKLKLQGRADKGMQTIPVDSIIGSVGRYTDFTRTFLPRRARDQERWANVKAATVDPLGQGLQPIEVYKVSDVYFVLDGNHRVSIARQEGWKTIQAHVIEIQTNILLTPDIQPDELIVKAEYANFLQQTGLNTAKEPIELKITIPGGYQKLLDEISARRQHMEEEHHKEYSLQDSAESWYRDIYLPFAEAVRERGMMRWFPDRTITDLYVWMAEHRGELEKELGWTIRPEAAAGAVIQTKSRRATAEESKTGSWRKARLISRYSEHLFKDILVPVGKPSEGWESLEQAIQVARREDAHIHGLHTVGSQQELENTEVATLQDRFYEMCVKEKVRGVLAIEVGEPAQKIMERSALTDLVVLKIVHPPSAGIQVVASPIRNLIARCPRPLLAVPGDVSGLHHALLAFDGSPKSKEALFVATYLAEQWKTQLTILTGLEDKTEQEAVQEFARNYLEFNEVEARFIIEKYSPAVLKLTAEEVNADLVIMGGYSGSILKEMTVGSSVNHMLRAFRRPVLICR